MHSLRDKLPVHVIIYRPVIFILQLCCPPGSQLETVGSSLPVTMQKRKLFRTLQLSRDSLT